MLVRTDNLCKRYGEQVALDGVDLRVPAGSVYGLVGPNGSGKTTLLSVLAGLRRPSSGSVEIAVDRRDTAVLPDTPQFEPWLTAHEVVDLARNLSAPQVPASRVDEVLADAGLSAVTQRRVGGFSRGMLQRLGIAATLVGEPRLVVLDEPCSALDPAGRREVLDLVARIGGTATVLFSSHILSDVQEVCDAVGVLREGRLLFQGALDELLVGEASPVYRIRLRSARDPVVAALRGQPWVAAVELDGADSVRLAVRSLAEVEEQLPGVLAATGARVVSLGPATQDLERVFLQLTGGRA